MNMKSIKQVGINILLVLAIIFIFILQLVRFVHPKPLTFENIFAWSNIKETFLVLAIIGVIFGPIYYLWTMKPKFGEQTKESSNNKNGNIKENNT